jgi:hypothetical protein
MRCRSEKFEAYALAFIVGIAEKDDPAFLLFLRERIGENDHRVHMERLIEVEQAAVRIDHNRLASFAEAPSVGILPGGDHAHLHEHPCTASNLVDLCLIHDTSMLRQFHFAVNESVANLFPPCNVGASPRARLVSMCLETANAL